MYELFEHTADLGLRVRAPDLPRLFEDAAAGLFSMIVEELPRGGDRRIEVRIEGQRYDYLLFDWLNELLYRFETEQLILGEFSVQLDPAGLRAEARGERADPERHRLLHEVKAITYHRLLVEQRNGDWFAELIVDI